MSDNPLSGKISLDTTDFKTAISQINQNLRLVESGFRASAASLGDWSKDANGLKQRMGALTDEIELQKVKVDLLQKEYQRVAKEKGENSRAAQNLLIRINKETEGLNKNQRELRETEKALDEVGDKSDKTGKHAKKMGDKFKTAEKKTISLKGALSGLGKMVKTIGVGFAAAAVAAVAAFAGLVAGTIGPASDLRETLSKTQEVFEGNAGAVIQFGKDAAVSLGMSQNAAVGAAATYGNLFRSMGIGIDVSTDMSMNLVTLAGDLASFNNMDPTEVLDKLRSGLSGETEPLKSLGVNINEALLKEKALEMGLWDGVDALDAAQKAQAAYALIMEQTTLAQGDFERTSGGLANQQRILAAQWENLKATAGGAFLPAVTSVTTALNTLLETAGPALQPVLDALGGSFGNLGDKVGGLLSGLGPILEMFGTMVSSLLSGDVAGAQDLLSGLIVSLLDMFEGVGAAGEGGGGVNILNFLIEGITNNIPRIIELASGLVLNFVTGILERIPLLISAGIEIIKALINGVLPQLPALLTTALEIIVSLANGLIAALPTLIPVVIQILYQLINTLIANLPMIIEAAFNLVVTLATGIAEALPTLIPTVIGIIPQIVMILLENLPLLIEAALNLLLALAQGIVAALPVLIEAVPQIITTIITMLINNLPMLITAAVEIITTLALGLVENIPLLLEAVVDIIVGIVEAFKNTDWKSIGDDLVNGIKEGFLSKWEDFKASITEKFNSLVESIKGLLGISSPSKLFAGIGENMASGLGGGFSKEMNRVNRDIRDTVGELESGWGFGGLNVAVQGAGAGATQSSPVINVSVQKVSDEVDEYRLARKIADQIRRNA